MNSAFTGTYRLTVGVGRNVPHPRQLLEWVLAAQALLVSVVGSALQMEIQLGHLLPVTHPG